MELLSNEHFYVLKQGDHSLWFSKKNYSITTKNGDYPSKYQCHGLVYGLIGIFDTNKLILISQSQLIGELPGGHPVFQVKNVIIVNLKTNQPLNVNLDVSLSSLFVRYKIIFGKQICKFHPQTNIDGKIQKKFNQIKSKASNARSHVGAKRNQNEFKEKRIIVVIFILFN